MTIAQAILNENKAILTGRKNRKERNKLFKQIQEGDFLDDELLKAGRFPASCR